MNSNLKETLYKATVLTFEELCFMFPAPEMEEELKDVKLEAMVVVEFQGPFNGELAVKTCGELYRAIPTNMLGEDDSTARQRRDALCEIANVICGNMLPGIAGPKEVFDISSPREMENGESGDGLHEDPAAEVCMALDQGKVEITLFINDEQPNA